MSHKIFAYVSNAKSKEIFVLELDAGNGSISVVEKVSVPGTVMPMAVSPDRRFLYAALRTEPYSVASFAIDALSGKLTHLGNAPVSGSMVYLSTDRSGRFLLGTTISVTPAGHQSTICINPISPHGFAHAPHQVIRSEPKTHSIQPDPSNRYLVTTACKGDMVMRHTFDAATGMLSYCAFPPVRVKTGAGPRHFSFHPSNRFLYLLNEAEGSIFAFGYDARTGDLRELQIVSTLPPDFDLEKSHGGYVGSKSVHAADIHVTPDGQFLYASVRSSHTLAAFKVDVLTGMLTTVGHFATEERPRGFNIDPFGRYLLAVGELSHSMTSYAIDKETGSLTKLQQYPMGKAPNWVEIVRLP